jgi:hypothetical protein
MVTLTAMKQNGIFESKDLSPLRINIASVISACLDDLERGKSMHAVNYLMAAPALLHFESRDMNMRNAPLEGQMLLDAVRFLDIFHCIDEEYQHRLEKATVVKIMEHARHPPSWRTLILQWLAVKATQRSSTKGESPPLYCI